MGTKELYIIDEYEEIYYLDADEVTIKDFQQEQLSLNMIVTNLNIKTLAKPCFSQKKKRKERWRRENDTRGSNNNT